MDELNLWFLNANANSIRHNFSITLYYFPKNDCVMIWLFVSGDLLVCFEFFFNDCRRFLSFWRRINFFEIGLNFSRRRLNFSRRFNFFRWRFNLFRRRFICFRKRCSIARCLCLLMVMNEWCLGPLTTKVILGA